MNSESDIPNNEFSTIYGENIKKEAPIMANFRLKNFLVRK